MNNPIIEFCKKQNLKLKFQETEIENGKKLTGFHMKKLTGMGIQNI